MQYVDYLPCQPLPKRIKCNGARKRVGRGGEGQRSEIQQVWEKDIAFVINIKVLGSQTSEFYSLLEVWMDFTKPGLEKESHIK